MSSAIIKMKRGSETDLAEVSKSILDDFKGEGLIIRRGKKKFAKVVAE